MTKDEAIRELERGIRTYAPVVAEFFHRTETLPEYSRALRNFAVDPIHTERQSLVASSITHFVKRLHGVEVTVASPFATNIVDHHAILNHPILTATNIVANADRLINQATQSNPIIVLSSSVVPPNNFFNRNGFQFHGRKIALFSNSESHQASCWIPKRKLGFLDRLKTIGTWAQWSDADRAFLENVERELYEMNDARAESYSDQVSLVNAFFWKQLFAPGLRAMLPSLYYVPQETLLRERISEAIAENTPLGRVLFNRKPREKALNAFRGLVGCWDEVAQKGTHFFWRRTESNEVERLLLEGDVLTNGKGFTLPLTREAIVEAVRSDTILPSLFVIFGYLVFTCGVRPLVGHGSSTYLTRMKDAWVAVLDGEDAAERDRISLVDTKGLIGGQLLTFRRDAEGRIVNQYAFDVIAAGGLTKDYLEHLFAMPFSDLLKPALLEIYESYVPVQERKELGLEPDDLMDKAFDWVK